MADILVHNAIKDIEAAINQGSSKINYAPMLGKTLKLYVKDIIDNTATGPYGTYGGGNASATQSICDLSNYNKIAYCLCAYAGSGTSCTDPFYNCPIGCPDGCYSVWRDVTVLPGNPGGSAQSKSQIRTFILASETADNGLKILEQIYGTNNTDVENDIYLMYLALKADYQADNNDSVLFAWYGIGGTYPQGSRISNTDYIKVCGGNWMTGEGANCTWTVPAGATCARFQLWGAGQGSNPGCCCGGSPGGSNGAYTEMTIKVTPGDSYVICAGCSQGSACCCSAYDPGYGCMSYVTGNGICCLKADGEFCYNTHCESFRCVNVCTGSSGGGCWYWGSQYCTNAGHCWCSKSEYCAVGCSTCGVVPVYGNCWTSGGGQYCNCATTACDVTSGEAHGHRGLIGGGCFDTNHYGYHIRPPSIDADTGQMFSDTTGCYCLGNWTSGNCCGGVLANGWGAHPGMGGYATHVMGGANQFYGGLGKGGMVQVSWVTT
tara:strand:+ start:418 stop:1887 length:1470 start_codon:yes stop_codon:yes gene_type:complete